MKVELFRHCMGRIHEKWLAREMGFTRTGDVDDIDLVRGDHGIEVKTRRIDAETLKITVHEHQRPKFKAMYDTLHWAFVYYRLVVNGLTVPDGCSDRRGHLNAIREAVTDDCSDRTLESYVTERKVFIKPWRFVSRYPVAHTKTGDYRYVRHEHLNITNRMIWTKKGPIYLPADFPFPAKPYVEPTSPPSKTESKNPNRETYVLKR